MRGHVVALLLAAAAPLQADPAPPFAGPGITLDAVGIFCRIGTTRREAAPGTTLGYVQLLEGMPELAFRQQLVPARLGVQFGVIVISDRDIAGVRNETWKPGASMAEVWSADLTAGIPRSRGFSFDFADELLPGVWRMQAFDGATLLYEVEFEVRPADQLPGVGSDCNLLS